MFTVIHYSLSEGYSLRAWIPNIRTSEYWLTYGPSSRIRLLRPREEGWRRDGMGDGARLEGEGAQMLERD